MFFSCFLTCFFHVFLINFKLILDFGLVLRHEHWKWRLDLVDFHTALQFHNMPVTWITQITRQYLRDDLGGFEGTR